MIKDYIPPLTAQYEESPEVHETSKAHITIMLAIIPLGFFRAIFTQLPAMSSLLHTAGLACAAGIFSSC